MATLGEGVLNGRADRDPDKMDDRTARRVTGKTGCMVNKTGGAEMPHTSRR